MPTCHSTNVLAMELLKSGKVDDGTIVITNEQTAGKGQRGNKWLSEPFQNLTFSIILNISFLKASQLFKLNMALSLAIIAVLKGIDFSKSEKYKVKWPNDVYYGENKLGGMLIETLLKADKSFWSIIGIGLNVNQTEFGRLNATSIKNIIQSDMALGDFLEKLTLGIESELDYLESIGFEDLKMRYLPHLYRYNVPSKFKNTNEEIFEGTIKDIDESGKILIEKEGSLIYFDKQELVFLR